MPDLPTFSELFRIARDEILSRNSKLSRDIVEREGSDANVMIAAACEVGDEVIGQVTEANTALWLRSARGQKLDRLIYDRYKLIRKPASAARGTVAFSTSTASASTFAIPSDTLLQTSDGIQFITVEDGQFSAGSQGPVYIAVRSVLAGIGQSAKIGKITSIVSAISSSVPDLVVTNPLATSGADDEEKDDDFIERAEKYYISVRKGTNPAIESAALAVPGVREAQAFEVLDGLGRPARSTQLVIADAFTEQFATFETTPPRYEQQSQQLAALVFEALSDTRPTGIYIKVILASVVLQPIQLVLAFTAGADINTAALQARAVIVNYVNALNPGSSLMISEAQNQLKRIAGLVIDGCAIVSPNGDVITKPVQVIRTNLGMVSAVSAQTNQPITTGTNPDAYILAGS